jgi:Neuraminidase (sialidase)
LALCCPLSAILAQWEPDQRLTNDTASSKTAENSNTWTVAATGDAVHVVWTDSRDGNDEIYYKRSTDGGATWGSDQRLTNADRRSWCPSVAAAGADVHVVWEDNRDVDWYDVYYKRSTDGGVTWGSDVKLSTTGLAFEPSVAVAGDTMHVVWDGLPSVDPGEPLEVYYVRSTDAGATWDSVIRLTNDSADYAWQPSVAAAGATVHIAWYDGRNGPASPAEIYYKRSTDGGATWGSDVRLTNSAPASEWVSIAAAGQRVHVAWSDARDGGVYEIYYKCSTDGGVTWPSSPHGDTRLTLPDSQASYFPSIAAAGADVHVVWDDRRDGTDEVYYKCSTDGGTTWGSDTRLSTGDKQSRHPSIAIAGSSLHIAWYDNRDGNNEIYYKRNPTGNTAVEESHRPQAPNYKPAATIVRGVLFLGVDSRQHSAYRADLLDAAGRKAMVLRLGANDVSHLAPGVYFVQEASGVEREASAFTKVLISR